MNVLSHTISELLREKLPGASSHLKMLPPGRKLEVPPHKTTHTKNSSVLLLLYQEESELRVILIKRPSFMKHHAGQIALPGGRMEDGETAVNTALRETYEEIGIRSEDIQILGKLSGFYVEVSNFQIQPIVGWLRKKPVIRLNMQEVEKTLSFPINEFKPPFQQVELQTITGKLLVPCIKYNGEIIWGATAMILAEFYDVIKDCILENHSTPSKRIRS
uniref:NUDIX hydrolase n=1 Tax=uncultured Draconibacterium sp. TaxID=1573823 RepID=UPI003217FEC9